MGFISGRWGSYRTEGYEHAMSTAVALEPVPDYQPLPQIPAFVRGYDGPPPSDVAAFKDMAELLAGAVCTIQQEYRRRPSDCGTLMLRAKALNIELGIAIDHIYINQRGRAGQSAQLISFLLRRAGIDWDVRATATYVEMDFFRIQQIVTRTGRTQNRRRKLGKVRYDMHETVAVKLSGGRTLADTYHWRTYPIPCMWARCIARAARTLFTGITLGMAYTAEEISLGSTAVDDDSPADEAPVHADVHELVEQAKSADATPELIMSDIMARARKARLLDEHAGDGATLQQMLTRVWDMKIKHRRDQETSIPADLAMAAAGYTARPPGDAWKLMPAGEGDLPCRCPASILTTGGYHVPGVCTNAAG